MRTTPASAEAALALCLALALGGCSTTGPITILDAPQPQTEAGPRVDAGPQPADPEQDGAPPQRLDVALLHDAVPRDEPRSRYGNPPSYEVFGKRYAVLDSAEGYVARGTASWYGTKFHGRRTSSGEPYDLNAMTAAHKTLPLPTYAEVTNLDNGRKIVVKINDRGPFHDDRIIDLSYAAATKLGILDKGTGRVEVRAISNPGSGTSAAKSAPPRSEPPAGEAVAQLYLQLGSFAQRENMQRLLASLLDAGIDPIQIRTSSEQDSIVYRLRVGPLRRQAEVDRLAQRLDALGIDPGFLVVD